MDVPSVHLLNGKRLSGSGSGRFIITNKKGSYFSSGNGVSSDFDGLFFYNNSMFKILSDIFIDDNISEVTSNISWFSRKRRGSVENFFLGSNSFIYELRPVRETTADFVFDCKRLYDDDDFGRFYNIVKTSNGVMIEYTKRKGEIIDYGIFVNVSVVAPNNDSFSIELVNEWTEYTLNYDRLRGMRPSRFFYKGFRISATSPLFVIFTFSLNKTKALKKTEYVLENYSSIINAIKKYPSQRFRDDDLFMVVAANALDSLVCRIKNEQRGIFAGLPWFFQFWGRDEAVSLGALIIQEHFVFAKEVLIRILDKIIAGDLSANSAGGEISVDEPGLVAFRLRQLILLLKSRGALHQIFSVSELNEIKDKMISVLDLLSSKRDLHGFLVSGSKDTWMDTLAPGDPGRPGARFEIQTLLLSIYDLIIDLGGSEFISDRDSLKVLVKDWFFDKRGFIRDGFFPDGSADDRVRPNLFLAWYFQPTLLSNEEWVLAFDHALKKLWLDWGGLSSIGKDDPLFRPFHSGIGDESYHRGDSWFFINNIAAIALFSVGPHRYDSKISSILSASTNDLLWNGFIGASSEVSDANHFSARGCRAQAWSAATLYELLSLIKKGSRLPC